ncbi:MAG: hypothetical protein PVJ08_09825 [Dehalococcoidia bacterium]
MRINSSRSKLQGFMLSLALIAVFVFGCGESAPPETRAGEWNASTDFGEFTLFVDSSGTMITSIEYSYQSCSKSIISGGVTFSNIISFEEGLPIEDNKFSLEMEGVSSMELKGTFSRDGTSASGSWKAGDCSGKWKVTKSQQNKPDSAGGKIAFVSGINIYVMNADGSGRTRLTDDPSMDWMHTWAR